MPRFIKNVNQGSREMCMECDCGKSHTGDEKTARFWYKIHGKVCIQARRTLPIYNFTIKETNKPKVEKILMGAGLVETLKIIETHCVKR
jgi:hypothetical protein